MGGASFDDECPVTAGECRHSRKSCSTHINAARDGKKLMQIKKLLAKPDAWNCLDEIEKEEILNLLPEDTHPNRYPPADDPDAKIPPLPEAFVRYSNEWRDGIRQFQADLEDGRYDPAWIRQAEAAVEERAAGKFDKFKEEEFEQFWGQKQKMDRTIAAGQSSQVKLATLVEHGVVRKGDVWRYSRSFSRGRNRVLLEKEVKVCAALSIWIWLRASC